MICSHFGWRGVGTWMHFRWCNSECRSWPQTNYRTSWTHFESASRRSGYRGGSWKRSCEWSGRGTNCVDSLGWDHTSRRWSCSWSRTCLSVAKSSTFHRLASWDQWLQNQYCHLVVCLGDYWGLCRNFCWSYAWVVIGTSCVTFGITWPSFIDGHILIAYCAFGVCLQCELKLVWLAAAPASVPAWKV